MDTWHQISLTWRKPCFTNILISNPQVKDKAAYYELGYLNITSKYNGNASVRISIQNGKSRPCETDALEGFMRLQKLEKTGILHYVERGDNAGQYKAQCQQDKSYADPEDPFGHMALRVARVILLEFGISQASLEETLTRFNLKELTLFRSDSLQRWMSRGPFMRMRNNLPQLPVNTWK